MTTVRDICQLERQIVAAEEGGFAELAAAGRLYVRHWQLAMAMLEQPKTIMGIDMLVMDAEVFSRSWDGKSEAEMETKVET